MFYVIFLTNQVMALLCVCIPHMRTLFLTWFLTSALTYSNPNWLEKLEAVKFIYFCLISWESLCLYILANILACILTSILTPIMCPDILPDISFDLFSVWHSSIVSNISPDVYFDRSCVILSDKCLDKCTWLYMYYLYTYTLVWNSLI